MSEFPKECNICFEDEEKGDISWETPCSNKHVYCKDCITRWMRECKKKRKKFQCPICKEDLDETIYIERELERRLEDIQIQTNQQNKVCSLLFHIFWGVMIPLGMIMLLIYTINTVRNKVSCVFASFFILFMLFLYIRVYYYGPDHTVSVSIHPS